MTAQGLPHGPRSTIGAGAWGYVISACWLWVAYVHVIRAPYHGAVQAVARSTWAGGTLGLVLAMSTELGGFRRADALLLALSLGLAAVAGSLTVWRLVAARATLVKFSLLPNAALSERRLHRFFDDEAVDVVVRSVGFLSLGAPDPDWVQAALSAVGHAQHVEPESVPLLNALAMAQAYMSESLVSARSTLSKVDINRCGFVNRVHSLMTEAVLGEMKGAQGDELDLTSYVELQERLKMVLQWHRDTAESLRDVWKIALRNRVGVSTITKMLHRVDGRERQAEMQYRNILQRYPTNARLLRAYGVFIQTVRGNIAAGNKYIQVRCECLPGGVSSRLGRAAGTRDEPLSPGYALIGMWQDASLAVAAGGGPAGAGAGREGQGRPGRAGGGQHPVPVPHQREPGGCQEGHGAVQLALPCRR